MGTVHPLSTASPLPFGARSFPDVGRQIPEPDSRWGYRSQYTEIGFPRLTAILQNADRGYTEEWGELSRRMLRTDSHLASVYETRLVGVAGARWEIDPGQGGDAAIAQRAADDCREMLEGITSTATEDRPDGQIGGVEQLFTSLLDGIGVGYAVVEIVWTVRAGRVLPGELYWIHPRRFRFDTHYRIYLYDDGRAGTYAPPDQRIRDAGAIGMKLSADKYIVHIPRTILDYAPMSGLLGTVARQWWVKQWATKYALQGAELAANPRAIASVAQETTDDAMTKLRQELENIAADGVIVIRGNTKIDFTQPLSEGSVRAWGELIDRMAADQSKGIIGSTINVEVGEGGGNRALGESQFDRTTLPRAQRDGRALWSTIERDFFRPFLRFNLSRYGGVMPPIPRGRFVLEEDPVEVDAIAVDAGVVTEDQLRISRGLPPVGPERGGDRMIPAKVQPGVFPGLGAPLPSSAPATPAAAGPDGKSTEEVASTGLNGAQIKELKALAADITAGLITPQQAAGIIEMSFPSATSEQIKKIIGFDPRSAPTVPVEAPAPVPAAPAVATPAQSPGGASAASPFRETPSPGSSTRTAMPWETARSLASRVSPDASPTSPSSPKKTRPARARATPSGGSGDPRSSRSAPPARTSQLGLPFSSD
jgi:phage gp29-like protein